MAPHDPPVDLFPPRSKITLVRNTKLDDAVKTAVGQLVKATSGSPAAEFGITIVNPANYAMGGFNDDKEFYVASLVKMGVMYAAFALREMVRNYVALRMPASPKALFHGLRDDLDGSIEHSSNLIFGGVRHAIRVPRYEDVFQYHNPSVEFTPSYAKALEDMIIPGDNHAAAKCIQGLGYGYLNGVLEQGGFFDSTAKPPKGIWVGGDFEHWPQVKIACVNDNTTAQGGTTEAFARLMAVIVLESFLGEDSHAHMRKLLKGAAHGIESSLLLRTVLPNPLKGHQVTFSKIGVGYLGPLPTGDKIYSEACWLEDIVEAGRIYIVAYANIDWKPYVLADIVTILKSAISIYEA